MGDLTDSGSPPPPSSSTAIVAVSSPVTAITVTPQSRSLPVREDCWSEEATSTLVDSWGRRYMELNRGNLRQKDWQEVADAVNALHGHTKKTHRTDVQCKNRVDTIKKKYKTEKARLVSSNGSLTSSWPFYDRMDVLIGSNVKPSPKVSLNQKLPSSPPVAVALPLPYRKSMTNHIPTASVVTPLPQKRTASQVIPEDEGFSFRRKQIDRNNYSMAAAAAAAAAADSEEEEAEEEEEEELEGESQGKGVRKLANAIQRFGQVYERVEGEKLRQMVELEKQRMQFAKDLELQRMRMLMDTQVQLERIKRGKSSTSNVISDSTLHLHGAWLLVDWSTNVFKIFMARHLSRIVDPISERKLIEEY
ncbi:trihelix transcription factor ENAP1-like [Rutidosis leptorrhynchoides]|uniref:trihelix transcription factor ENAP1-like n=1 Tax=Rutidosis leptorrhynchoides TaxID=125765 RepID=UPI003A9A0427